MIRNIAVDATVHQNQVDLQQLQAQQTSLRQQFAAQQALAADQANKLNEEQVADALRKPSSSLRHAFSE